MGSRADVMSCHVGKWYSVSRGLFMWTRPFPSQSQHPLLKVRPGAGCPPRACPTESSVNPWLTTTSQAWRLALTIGEAGTQVSLRPGPQQSADAEAHARPQNWLHVCPTSLSVRWLQAPVRWGQLWFISGLIINSVLHVFKSRTLIPER